MLSLAFRRLGGCLAILKDRGARDPSKQPHGYAIATSPYHPDLNARAVLASGQRGSAEGTRQGRSDGIAKGVIEEAEGEDSNRRAIEKAGIFIPAPYGVLWRLKPAHQIWRKFFRIMVSALGLEPRTHALKVLLTAV